MKQQLWKIRRAEARDVDVLVEFNCELARETEGKELDRQLVTRGVARGLQQGDEVIYYVADLDGALIGALMLTREWSDWRDGWLVWVQSVFVVAPQRGQGVFRSLLEHAIETVRRNPDVVGLRLYVDTENIAAQSVYMRTGFTDPNYKVLERLWD